MNPWNLLSGFFDTHKSPGDIDPSAADNILIAWPVIFEGVKKAQNSGQGLTAFDFGCGVGSFAGELACRGYQVAASDTSSEMIQIARKHLGSVIDFHVAGAEIAATLSKAPFALISSVMVFPFIQNIESVLDDLDQALIPDGLLAVAVFNPDYVYANIGAEGGFAQTDKPFDGTDILMVMNDTRVPLYLRSEVDYNALFSKRGYVPVLCKKPEFTHDFLQKYPTETNTNFPEYIIMVYQKKVGLKPKPAFPTTASVGLTEGPKGP